MRDSAGTRLQCGMLHEQEGCRGSSWCSLEQVLLGVELVRGQGKGIAEHTGAGHPGVRYKAVCHCFE